MEALMEIIDELGGKKFVIFSQFTQVLNRIYRTLLDYGIDCIKITGGQSANERELDIKLFQNDPNCLKQGALVNVHAGGVGITLTAASIGIAFDKPWTPAAWDQAKARLHRIGIKETVNIIEVLAESSIDQWIEHLLLEKQGIVDRALDQSNIRRTMEALLR
jgi:SNF2 family DNA or RNA helicase